MTGRLPIHCNCRQFMQTYVRRSPTFSSVLYPSLLFNYFFLTFAITGGLYPIWFGSLKIKIRRFTLHWILMTIIIPRLIKISVPQRLSRQNEIDNFKINNCDLLLDIPSQANTFGYTKQRSHFIPRHLHVSLLGSDSVSQNWRGIVNGNYWGRGL